LGEMKVDVKAALLASETAASRDDSMVDDLAAWMDKRMVDTKV
jgi:hypothetical protein